MVRESDCGRGTELLLIERGEYELGGHASGLWKARGACRRGSLRTNVGDDGLLQYEHAAVLSGLPHRRDVSCACCRRRCRHDVL
jgi:hypothetical protein